MVVTLISALLAAHLARCAPIAVAAVNIAAGAIQDHKSEIEKRPAPAASRPASADWPTFRGNPQLSGVAACILPETLEKRWSYQSGEAVQSSAAIVNGVVYVGSGDGHLHAIDLKTGRLRWKFNAGGPIQSSPAVYGGAVFFGDENGIFHCVDAASGAKRWDFKTDAEIISSAGIANERVYFGSYDSNVRCFSLDGKLLWRFETEGKVHGTPAIVDGRLLISGCDSYLRSLSLEDGKELGKVPLGSYTGASPAVLGDDCYVGTYGERVLAVNWREGSELWYYEHPQRKFPYLSSAAVTDKYVVLGGRDKIIRCLQRESGKAIWEFSTRSRVDGSPVISGERVFIGSGDGILYAFELASGKKTWDYTAGAPFSASPAIADDCLVIGDEDGVVFCFAAREKK